MNKKLFFLAIAALGLAACSNDDVVEINQSLEDANSISFRPFANGMTRAADAHFNVSGDQFKVTAFETGDVANTYFSDVVFQGDGSTFTSTTNKYYWPSGYNLDFWAYAPVSNNQITYVTKNSDATNYYKKFTVTPSTTVTSQVDLVYARTNDWGKVSSAVEGHQLSTTITGVTINFRHAESKVAIALKNSNPNLTYTVNKVSIGNLKGTGTFIFAESTTDTKDASNISGGWTPSGDATVHYDQTLASAYTVTSSGVEQGAEMILIPQTLSAQTTYTPREEEPAVGDLFKGAYIAVDLNIQNNAGDAAYILGNSGVYVTAIWPLAADTWNPGYKYTYTVDLAGGGYHPTNQDENNDLDPILEGAEIKFVTVTVDGWDDYDSDGSAEGVQPINVSGPNS